MVCGGESLTYGELDARAGPAGRHLRAAGRGAGGGSALCLERSPELVVALLGVLKAGGAYVPLDPDLSRRSAGLHAGRTPAPPLVLRETAASRSAEDAAGASAARWRGGRASAGRETSPT